MISSIPPDDVLDRASLEYRLREVEDRLATVTANTRLPLTAKLTFRGRPVIGSQGVFAEFGMEATKAFTEAVTTMAASLSGPLAAMGPIPNRDQNQLVITGTAIGSFGFELQENADTLLFGEETTVGQALLLTQKLMESTIGSDDEMTDAMAGVDPRVIKATRDFLDTLATNDAVCGLTVGAHAFHFSGVGQVRTAIDRLAQDNLHKDEATFTGMFQGVLPKRRTFEFLVQNEGTVILGKVGSGVADPALLNRHLSQLVTITLTATRVGSGRPKYVLNVLPPWPGASPA
ncbi:MAG TPA: hypothetical protein VH370_27560 [Humisphaera sp.]|jgi:hypothetical protein|nr:hypothetical protein [Humisphaera sp.]